MAEQFLRARGFAVLERNWRSRHGEIDLIVRNGSALVFVEVKRRADSRHGHPIQQVSVAQRRRAGWAARRYLATHPPDPSLREIRFDVIGLVIQPGRKPEITWVADAFRLR